MKANKLSWILITAVGIAGACAQSSWVVRETGTSANLWGAAVLQGPAGYLVPGGRVVVVGEQGTILTSEDGGQSWTRRQSGTLAWLTATYYDSALRRIFVVGDGGLILSSVDGLVWTRETSPTTVRLNGIAAGASGGRLYAVGEPGAGLLLRDGEGVWIQHEGGFGSRWMRGLTQRMAVGQGGAVFSPPYSTPPADVVAPWEATAVPTSADLEAFASGPLPLGNPPGPTSTEIAVGADGTILQRYSTGWVARNSGTTERLRGICRKDGGQVMLVTMTLRIPLGEYFVVGTSGTILRSKDGLAWQPDTSPTQRNLNSVTAVNNTVLAVGDGGVILQTGGNEAAPVITRAPSAGSGPDGKAYAEVETRGPGMMTHLWVELAGGASYAVGTDYPRQSLATLRFSDVHATFQLLVGNAFGITRSTTFTLNRYVNLSSRAVVGRGDRGVIGGFSVGSRGDTAPPHTFLIRVAGPSLGGFGVAAALKSPRLALFAGSQLIAANEGWESNADVESIRDAVRAAGAFPLLSGSADCALLVKLVPGNYTAQVTSTDDSAGIALLEVYDLEAPRLSRLKNLSARGHIQPGEGTLISGLVIDGALKKSVLLRAAGPALSLFGLQGVLARPQLSLFKDGNLIAIANEWGAAANASDLQAAAAKVNAFEFAPGSADSSILLHLDPGAYTLQVQSVDGGSGIALVEVYEMP